MELLPVTASLDPSAEVPAAHLNGMHAPCSPRPPLSAAALVAPGGALSWAAIRGSGLARCVLLDRAALVSALPTLRAAVEGGAWIMWFFLADRTALLNSTGRVRGGWVWRRRSVCFMCGLGSASTARGMAQHLFLAGQAIRGCPVACHPPPKAPATSIRPRTLPKHPSPMPPKLDLLA